MSENSHGRQADGGHGDLEEEIARLLPTPTSGPREARGSSGRCPSAAAGTHGRKLVEEMAELHKTKLMPTPNAWDGARGADFARADREQSGDDDLLTYLVKHGMCTSPPSDGGKPSSAGLRLNPSFVEWMIGAPAGWTDPGCPLSATEFKSRPAGCAGDGSWSTP